MEPDKSEAGQQQGLDNPITAETDSVSAWTETGQQSPDPQSAGCGMFLSLIDMSQDT